MAVDRQVSVLDEERDRAERKLNTVRGVVLLVLAIAAAAYAPVLPRSLNLVNAAILAPMGQKGGQGMLAHIDKMAALHDILTPAQRQQMVTMMEQHMEQFKQHMGQFHGQRGKWRHHGDHQQGDHQNAQ